MTQSATTSTAWSPFATTAFAVLWAATLLSNVGTWMHDVAAGWLMTSLSPSPLMVALVQAATTLPVFLFALPSGALADLIDRRRLLLSINAVMAALAFAIGVLAMRQRVDAALLLAFTFALGTCTALIAPTWQAIVPQLVSREQLSAAVALNSLGVNISRAIGPTVGTALIVAFGVAWPFFANALSFMAVIGALIWWRQPAVRASITREPFARALWAGLRYARSSEPLRATLIRALAFFSCASAYWALLPLIARVRLHGDANVYGVLVTSIGAGAIVGAITLPKLRARVGADRTAIIGVAMTACALLGFAFAESLATAVLVSLSSGAAWITVLSSLNVSAQAALPDWVRARGLSVYNACFFGAMAIGSVAWGQMAQRFGIAAALIAAAALLLVIAALTVRFKLHQPSDFDLTPANAWQRPLHPAPAEERTVLTSIEYVIDPAREAEFVRALESLAAARRRNGARHWVVYRDAARAERFIEQFEEPSWADHLRHHERMTRDDRALQVRIEAMHRGDTPPVVTHLVAAR